MKKTEDNSDEENEMTTNRSLKKSKNNIKKKKKGKKTKTEKDKSEPEIEDDSKESSELELSYQNREKPEECLNHLLTFYNSLNNIDLDNLITKKNLKYFKNLNPNENVEIDLYLSKIYAKIFSSDDFYKKFFFK